MSNMQKADSDFAKNTTKELIIYFIKAIGEMKKKPKYVDTIYDTIYNIDRRHGNVEMG